MKKLLTLALFLLLSASLHAQKRSSKKQMLTKSATGKEKQKPQTKLQEASALDNNTRGWLHEIRVKIYGLDMDRKKGKGGC